MNAASNNQILGISFIGKPPSVCSPYLTSIQSNDSESLSGNYGCLGREAKVAPVDLAEMKESSCIFSIKGAKLRNSVLFTPLTSPRIP